MNAASQWRYALAQTVAPIYAANPHVAAVLIEQHVPGVDVARLRTIFRFRRPQWEQAPPGSGEAAA
jgi:hypothetical protein